MPPWTKGLEWEVSGNVYQQAVSLAFHNRRSWSTVSDGAGEGEGSQASRLDRITL